VSLHEERTDRVPPPWITACVLGLVVMATWTLVIKFVAPLAWFVAERAAGRPIAGPPILWDFWWVAHLALAHLLWVRHRWAWGAGVAVAGIEIGTVAVKLALWFSHPDLSFWRLLWLTNKLYVLAFFLLLLALLWKGELRGLRPAHTPGRRAGFEAAPGGPHVRDEVS